MKHEPTRAADRVSRASGALLSWYIRLVRATSAAPAGLAEAQSLQRSLHPCIAAFWHGQFMLIPAMRPGDLPVRIMVARHHDAEMIAQAILRFGMGLIRGAGAGGRSTDRGGSQAFVGAVKSLAEGLTVGMTADVVPGPARRAGLGVVTLAKVSGRPILPIAAASSHYMALNSWSRMTINLPLSRLGIGVGEPIFVPADADQAELERLRVLVEDRLNGATADAYRAAGADSRRATPGSMYDAAKGLPAPGRLLRAYHRLTQAVQIVAPSVLRLRARFGKQDPTRTGERLGFASVVRPAGQLAWLHARTDADVVAVNPLIAALMAAKPGLNILVTTRFRRADVRANPCRMPVPRHFVPIDAPDYSRRFLAHWQPDIAIFAGAEIRPNMILACAEQHIPLALVDGFLPRRASRRWRLFKGLCRPVFGRFDLVIARNPALARRFLLLGSRGASVGDLMMAVDPLLALIGQERAHHDMR